MLAILLEAGFVGRETMSTNTPAWLSKLPRHKEPVPHIRWSDLEDHMPEALMKQFEAWMAGQTGLVCDDGELGVYTWDFDRWVRQGMKTQQGADWD